MKRIINGYLYDTETADLIYTDFDRNRRYYATNNYRYFVALSNGLIMTVSVETIKMLLGTYDINKYIELFGEPKEG